MNKKISRLLEPNLKLYFLCLALFALAAIPVSPVLAGAEGVAIVALYFYFRNANHKRKQGIIQYIDNVTGSVDTASKSTLINSPLPIMVFRPDTGEVIWSNESFLQLAGVREHLFEIKVGDAVPQFSSRWLLEGKRECPERVDMNSRKFRVYGSLVSAAGGKGQGLLATTYWVDTTENDEIRQKYETTRPVVAILTIDNYEDLMKSCPEAARSAVLAQIYEKINTWAAPAHGVLLKTDRDHYLFVFEEQYYARFAAEKFAVLDTVRDIKVGEGVHATLSVGVGKDADTLEDLFQAATLSVEMALSRGGDQAAVKSRLDFEFYGGRAKSTEKRTKVKSRVMANALSELMADAKQIYIMGHANADMDAIGAAVGLCCIARKRGKHAQIVLGDGHNAAGPLLDCIRPLPEYAGTFISGNEAFLRMQAGSLLIVVDTNRPECVEHPQLLETCNRVAVIDHHRRAASYIENAALNFHEPYASSTSELVTELLQYLAEPTDLLRAESEALLAGIVLDTKNFTMRTGGRTFEAAAFLRRAGAETAEVQRLFQNDLTETISRYAIIRQAELYRDNLAVAFTDDADVDRVTVAQAADELLTLKGVQASFVACRVGEGVALSARSLGDINVQVILEALGGGGNSTTAGGRIENATAEEVRPRLLAAIDSYFEK
ncbi:MAG: DHH family phosphoesterase [Oscillospiraceae bacterium]